MFFLTQYEHGWQNNLCILFVFIWGFAAFFFFAWLLPGPISILAPDQPQNGVTFYYILAHQTQAPIHTPPKDPRSPPPHPMVFFGGGGGSKYWQFIHPSKSVRGSNKNTRNLNSFGAKPTFKLDSIGFNYFGQVYKKDPPKPFSICLSVLIFLWVLIFIWARVIFYLGIWSSHS